LLKEHSIPTPGLEDYLQVIEEAVEILLKRKLFLTGAVFDSIAFIGDTHGFPECSLKALDMVNEEKVEHVVFMGDYVDRGPRGLENLYLILSAFVAEPSHITLLRGNHETPAMNYSYGFYNEIICKLGDKAYAATLNLYKQLPYAIIVNKWFVVHGGIPCRKCGGEAEDPFSINELAKILEAIRHSEDNVWGSQRVALHMLWNDPRGNIEWFMRSWRGEGIYYYGRIAWKVFLETNKLKGIIRAHEPVDALAYWTKTGSLIKSLESRWRKPIEDIEGSVITLFSSKYHGKRAGMLIMRDNSFELRTL